MSDLDYPDNLSYTTDHEWVEDRGDGVYRVGITQFAQNAMGDVVYVSLPAVGDAVELTSPCGEVESTKSVSDILSPLEGEITAVNQDLETSPETINADPYGEGWMFEVKVGEGADTSHLMDAETYAAQLD